MADRNMVDILRVEGIMAQGYGINPKLIMRDKRLTPEAKAIYSYIASFAGGGNQAFPSREIMLSELQMSKDRYYKHLKYLTDADYIRIERTKGRNGSFDRNIYTMVAMPNPASDTEKSPKQKQKAAQSAGRMQEYKKTQKQKVKKASSVNKLRERLQIDQLKEGDPEKGELIEEVFMAAADMDNSEQISIGGNVKKKEAIQELLNQLTADHIRLVVNTMANNKKRLINRKSYLQTCIANSIFDIRNNNQAAAALIKQKEEQEAEERKQQKKEELEKRELEIIYEQHPEIKRLDEEMTELMKKKTRAVLSKNEVMSKSLKRQYEELTEKRAALVKEKALHLSV